MRLSNTKFTMLRRRRKDDGIRMITMLGSSYGRVTATPSMDMAVGEDYVEKTTSIYP
jgi:hypothetical protein